MKNTLLGEKLSKLRKREYVWKPPVDLELIGPKGTIEVMFYQARPVAQGGIELPADPTMCVHVDTVFKTGQAKPLYDKCPNKAFSGWVCKFHAQRVRGMRAEPMSLDDVIVEGVILTEQRAIARTKTELVGGDTRSRRTLKVVSGVSMKTAPFCLPQYGFVSLEKYPEMAPKEPVED